jgi:hypothetical protein
MTTVKMEVGKTYTTADGKTKVTITSYNKGGGRYRWNGDNGMSYTMEGRMFYSMPDKEDLVHQVD